LRLNQTLAHCPWLALRQPQAPSPAWTTVTITTDSLPAMTSKPSCWRPAAARGASPGISHSSKSPQWRGGPPCSTRPHLPLQTCCWHPLNTTEAGSRGRGNRSSGRMPEARCQSGSARPLPMATADACRQRVGERVPANAGYACNTAPWLALVTSLQ